MPTLSPEPLLDELRARAARHGAVGFGVADMNRVRTDDFLLSPVVLSQLNRAVALALPLSRCVLATLDRQPNLLYEHHYRQVNFALDRLALALSMQLEAAGHAALPIPASQLVDWTNQRDHLSHKRIAVAAGLGWLGRSNLLVTPSRGAQVRLVTILTDAPLPAGSPLNTSCGQCRACVAACPARAIGDDAAGFAHRACFEKLKEFQRRRLVGQYICGLCVQTCAGTAASAGTGNPDPPTAPD